jgi:predicted RNase H-like nuclease (RuvC/YqgF family)
MTEHFIDRRARSSIDMDTVSKLIEQVTKVTVIAEQWQRQREEDLRQFNRVIDSVDKLNDRISSLTGLSEDVAQLKEDTRVIRHDLNEVKNAQQTILILDKKAAELELRISSLEKLLEQMKGAIGMIKLAWIVLAGGGAAVIAWVYANVKVD